jgi:hypothetical protein
MTREPSTSVALLFASMLCAWVGADAQTPGLPCCAIVGIDAEAGIVTVKVNATGNIFQFKSNNPATLASLKAGQAVYANFTNHQVSLDGRTICCVIASGPQPATAVGAMPIEMEPTTANTAPPSGDPPACCVVTGVDITKGIMSGRDLKTGYTFKYVVRGARVAMDSMKVVWGTTPGQKIWASLRGKGVMATYGTMCCAIVEESDH